MQRIDGLCLPWRMRMGLAPFGGGGFRYHTAAGGTEPLPLGMVVEMAENDDLVRARDQIDGGFVQYVRADDLAIGEKWRPRAHARRAMAPISRASVMCLGSPGNTRFI